MLIFVPVSFHWADTPDLPVLSALKSAELVNLMLWSLPVSLWDVQGACAQTVCSLCSSHHQPWQDLDILTCQIGTDGRIERVINFGQMTDCCLKEDIKGLLAGTQ